MVKVGGTIAVERLKEHGATLSRTCGTPRRLRFGSLRGDTLTYYATKGGAVKGSVDLAGATLELTWQRCNGAPDAAAFAKSSCQSRISSMVPRLCT